MQKPTEVLLTHQNIYIILEYEEYILWKKHEHAVDKIKWDQRIYANDYIKSGKTLKSKDAIK